MKRLPEALCVVACHSSPQPLDLIRITAALFFKRRCGEDPVEEPKK